MRPSAALQVPAHQQMLRSSSTIATTSTVNSRAGAAAVAALVAPQGAYWHCPLALLSRMAGAWPSVHSLRSKARMPGGVQLASARVQDQQRTQRTTVPAAAWLCFKA